MPHLPGISSFARTSWEDTLYSGNPYSSCASFTMLTCVLSVADAAGFREQLEDKHIAKAIELYKELNNLSPPLPVGNQVRRTPFLPHLI